MHAEDLLSRVVLKTDPLYPPIAKAAQIEGAVTVRAKVNASGNIVMAKAIAGPEMLRSAAEDSVRSWKFKKASSATEGDVVIVFHLPGKKRDAASIHAAKLDSEIQQRYFPKADGCRNTSSPSAKEERAILCVEAAKIASEYPDGTRWLEKRSAYTAASRALLSVDQLDDSLRYADMAVDASEKAGDDHAGRTGVYSNRGLARAVAGKYDDAIADFQRAEKESHLAITWAATIGKDSAFLTYEYNSALMWTMMYYAKTLEVTGRTEEAKAKYAEATALKTKLDNMPRPQMP